MTPLEVDVARRLQAVMARACSNIALIKYWGKRDAALNLPATGSLSLTLEGLTTATTVAWGPTGAPALAPTGLASREADLAPGSGPTDVIGLDGKPAGGKERERIVTFLDQVRALAGLRGPALVESVNDFPRAAGLASSASGFAALALAATRAAGLDLSPPELSALARRGSGSACRSLFGGFVEWLPGTAPDGRDSHAVQILPPEAWDVRMLVAVLSEAPKPTGSRDAMNHTVATSPYFPAWRESVPADLASAKQAIAARDLAALGELAESNALRMHATMLAARPPVLYWLPATIAAMHQVWELRESGLACWFTIDAGPNVKVLCAPESEPQVRVALLELPGITRVISARPGPGAQVVRIET